jgi:Polysaccharide lyase
MKGIFVGIVAVASFVALQTGALSAKDRGTFDPFVVDDLSAPKTARLIKDPTGSSPTPEVYSFSIPSGYCNPKRYDPSTPDSDCKYNSARSQIRENVFATKKYGKVQPSESWYGWDAYFPKEFPFGASQTRGHYEFAYWHNHQCPHLSFAHDAGTGTDLYLQTNVQTGNYECAPGVKLPVSKFSDLLGKWSRFEVFVKWADNKGGKVEVFLGGKQVLNYDGPNLTKGLEDINYFKFGLYLCCTSDHKQIKATSVLFTNVKRAAKREQLFSKQ